jgi:hypothetical protein
MNDKVWGGGVGVGSGEVKAGASVVAVRPVAERVVGPGARADNKDNTSSNEIFWVKDVS